MFCFSDQPLFFSSLFLSLLLFSSLSWCSTSSDDKLKICARKPGRDRFLSFWVDGLRSDLLEQNLFLLPNFQRLIDAGVHAPCPSVDTYTCARSTLGNRYAPNPIAFSSLGPQNITDSSGVLDFLNTYHWTSFSGFGSTVTGLDTPYVPIRSDGLEEGARFVEALSTYVPHGTFLKRAHDYKLKTAVTGTPSVLTADWKTSGMNVTPGVLDYECGIRDDGFPTVVPSDTKTCNMDFRRAISEEEFHEYSDSLGVEFVNILLERGCAHLIIYHMNAPEYAMHTYGIGSPEYIQSLIETDTLIGSVLDTLEHIAKIYSYTWLVITTSDHGGTEVEEAPYINVPDLDLYQRLDHSSNWLKDEVVPFIISSFGKEKLKFSALSNPVHNYDLSPTVLKYFHLEEEDDFFNGKVQGLYTSGSISNIWGSGNVYIFMLTVWVYHFIR